jgi:hypothetical protein
MYGKLKIIRNQKLQFLDIPEEYSFFFSKQFFCQMFIRCSAFRNWLCYKYHLPAEEAFAAIISFNAVSIREWPLFIDFRKAEYYEKFKEEHNSDFNEFIFEDSQLSEKKASNDECKIDDKENEEQLSCK